MFYTTPAVVIGSYTPTSGTKYRNGRAKKSARDISQCLSFPSSLLFLLPTTVIYLTALQEAAGNIFSADKQFSCKIWQLLSSPENTLQLQTGLWKETAI